MKLFLLSIGFILLTLGMQEISSILLILFFSFFTALIFAPLVRWLQRKRVPPLISVGMVLLLFILITAVFGLLTSVTVTQLSERIPVYETELTEYTETIVQYIPSVEEISIQGILQDIVASLVGFGMRILNGIINATTTILLILFITTFLLLDSAGTSQKIKKELGEEFVLLEKLHDLGKVVMRYVIVRTETNLITALGITVILFIANIEFAIFWGVVIFIFSYIPFIGLTLASIPPALLALLQYGPAGAIILIISILFINLLADEVLFPSLAGRDLELSPSVVLLSLIYWTYVLGPAGAIISTPLIISIKIILESFEETEELSKLMNSKENHKREKKSDDKET
ncbi:AI-2E family transporter [Methanolobus halotolerans]|uniref:AI-2E family transporter n=1 Tax=Methanolobus halotolerans TaxID=2052935 RepID=A0A4E0R1B2_9EURY|nr:AI-2E family transporter [Methanolobus halotolerans]TGC10949.1 AI-2E family transporter [Methanolobus halotolerans]